MNNQEYILLYGIAPAIDNFSVQTFKNVYFSKPIELFRDTEYVKKKGAMIQTVVDNNTEEISLNRDYIGIVIKRCSILDTSKISNQIQNEFNHNRIKNHNDEIKFIGRQCRKSGLQAFSFPPKYEIIDSKLSTMQLIKPRAYIIVDPNIIIDIAIGINNINRMINKLTQ